MIIEQARKDCDARVAFFYCRQDNHDYNGFMPVARGILSQLAAQNERIVHFLYEQQSQGAGIVLSRPQLAESFLEMTLKIFDRLYIVIDGLDECPRDERKKIADVFCEIVESVPPNNFGIVRCLFISQDDGIARKDLSRVPSIKIEAHNTAADIKNFCQGWHTKIEQRFRNKNMVNEDIVNKVTSRAAGKCGQLTPPAHQRKSNSIL